MNKHAIVSGHVQGVGFRFTARERAEQLGLTGWVRNLPDGTVELEVEGNADTVRQFMDDLKAGFHSHIQVDDIDEKDQATTNQYADFSIR